MSKKEKLLLYINVLIYGVLAVFSYSYVDLNLTISQNQLVLRFVAFMQQIGYYTRPQATFFYSAFIVTAFIFFAINLLLFFKGEITARYLKLVTVSNVLILIFAYPFLSSDLFNYLFDAKILLNYHQSPYTHKPLDFPQDEWLRFMRWTHRYSPYGPFWLLMSLIPALLGFGKFILNFLAFKIFIGSFHLVNSYLIFKTLEKINPRFSTFGTASYALNPLFLIEGVVNAHNDVVSAAFIIAPVYLLASNKNVLSAAVVFLGTLIKYISVLTLPWVILKAYKKLETEKFIILSFLTMSAFTYVFSSFKISVPFVSTGSTQVQFQPWYLFWTLPLLSLVPRPKLTLIMFAAAFGASLRYLPYLYYGDWSHPQTTSFMTIVTLVPITLALIFFLLKIKSKNA